MIGEVLGHFEILERLGAGGMGEVYLARDRQLDRHVALKLMQPELAADPEARRRFEREARALAALDHPFVGAVHGVGEAGGRIFLVLAYIEGVSLESLLASGPLDAARARVLLPRIAEGLRAAHRRGVVHRDIKTSNIMVASGDVPKLVDFGIALRDGESRLTDTGFYAGTPGFTAPEVFRGEPADVRSDVFSLGVVLHRAITGGMPFAREHPAAVLHAVLHEEPAPFPPGAPAELRALEPVVQRCLAKDPAQRFADAGEVADALAAWAAGTTLEGATAPMPSRAPVRRRRPGPSRAALVLVAAAAIGAAILAGIAVLGSRRATGKSPAGATSSKRSVAVLEFENDTGDPSLDWMSRGVAQLLGAALVQSSALDVYDAQRLGDLAASGDGRVSAPSYGFLAGHGIRRAIAGNILRSGRDLQLQGRVVETGDGRLVHAYTVSGPADSGLFHLVARLIPVMQVALEVNLTGDREAEGWLREITTTSPEAYRLYLRGHEALLASHWKEAAAAFEQALALDSLFVAARTELSGAYWNLGDGARLQVTRAALHRQRGRADLRDRLRIDLFESIVGNDPAGTARAAGELVQLYPENRFYSYLLGRGYFYTHRYRECLATLEPLVAQGYTWGWTYVLSARSSAQLGDTTGALRLFDRGLVVTHHDPEVAYTYVRFLRATGRGDSVLAIIGRALSSPSLPESPVAEGELRIERAMALLARGDPSGAREEVRRAASLVPVEDEARHDVDSLRRVLRVGGGASSPGPAP